MSPDNIRDIVGEIVSQEMYSGNDLSIPHITNIVLIHLDLEFDMDSNIEDSVRIIMTEEGWL